MFQAIAFHHPKPEHVGDWLPFMERVIAAADGADGLLEFTMWREPGDARLIGLSRWTSEAAFHAALPRVMSLEDEHDPAWDAAPDVVVTSVAASAVRAGRS